MRYRLENSHESYSSNGKPLEAGLMPMGVLICLCGQSVQPKLAGFRGGKTPNSEMARFFTAIFGALTLRHARNGLAADLDALQQELASAEALSAVRDGAEILDDQIKSFSGLEFQTKRSVRAIISKRAPYTDGMDGLVVALQHRGFTFDHSRFLVRTIFQIWEKALEQGESVETPCGWIEPKPSPRPYARVRFGREQAIFRQRVRVQFRPTIGWEAAGRAQRGQMQPMGEAKRMTQKLQEAPLVCQCGSEWFYEVSVNQYYQGRYSSAPGGEIQPKWERQEKVHLCLCGRPHYIRRRLAGRIVPDDHGLLRSIELAAARIDEWDSGPERLKQISESALRKTDLDSLLNRLHEADQNLHKLRTRAKEKRRAAGKNTAQ